MAKKLDAKEGRGVSASDLKRSVKDFNRHRQNASENAGLAGQAKAQSIERHNLNGWAFSQVCRLERKEDLAKAQDDVLSLFEYALKLGLLDQVDAFNDRLAMIREFVDRAENQTAPENVGREAEAPASDAGAPTETVVTH